MSHTPTPIVVTSPADTFPVMADKVNDEMAATKIDLELHEVDLAAAATHAAAAAPHGGHEATASKGVAGGYAGLDASAQIEAERLSTDVVGVRLEYVSTTQIKLAFDKSNQIRVYNPTTSRWELIKLAAEPVLANTALDLDSAAFVSGYNYDVFAEYSSLTAATLVAKKWTSDTARAVSPGRLNGVLCYDNSTDNGKKRRYIGTIRLVDNAGTPNFAWTATKRFVWNYYNRQGVYNQITDSTAHSYTTGAYRAWNDDEALTKLEWVEGYATDTHAFDILFSFTAAAAGDRCITRANLNGSGIDYKTSVAASNVFHRDAVTQHYNGRAGYNYAYMEEYGYATSPTFSSMKFQVTMNQ